MIADTDSGSTNHMASCTLDWCNHWLTWAAYLFIASRSVVGVCFQILAKIQISSEILQSGSGLKWSKFVRFLLEFRQIAVEFWLILLVSELSSKKIKFNCRFATEFMELVSCSLNHNYNNSAPSFYLFSVVFFRQLSFI